MQKAHTCTLLLLLLRILLSFDLLYAFSHRLPDKNNNDAASFTLFDRFHATCPADPQCIQLFDSTLALNDPQRLSTWAAVYRSSNNKPSVLIRDDFLNAMLSATGGYLKKYSSVVASSNMKDQDFFDQSFSATSIHQRAPVAVARLRPATDHEDNILWVLDNMRCVLRKEDTNLACDGESEYAEAIATAIDALLEHYLSVIITESSRRRFEGAIRVKATLYSAKLLEDRGFQPVTRLDRDMATHISSLDGCLEKYATRSVTTSAKTPGARQRALNIVSMLGRMDRETDLRAARDELLNTSAHEQDLDDFDPWAGLKRFI